MKTTTLSNVNIAITGLKQHEEFLTHVLLRRMDDLCKRAKEGSNKERWLANRFRLYETISSVRNAIYQLEFIR